MSAEAGEQLRAARLRKGLSEADIAASLKVPVRYIEALDRGDPAGLPEPAFVRGYVRGYARLVGVDPDEVCALLAPVEIKAPRQQVGIAGMPGVKAGRAAGTGGGPLKRLARHHRLAGFLILVAGVGVTTWTAYEPELAMLTEAVSGMTAPAVPVGTGTAIEVPLPEVPGAAAESLSAETPAPAETGPVQLPPVPAAPQPAATSEPPVETAVSAEIPRAGLYVRFSGDCWIEVRDADNVVIHHATGAAGNDLRLTGKEPLVVTLGNAGRAQLWWNGDPVKVDAFSRAGVARVNLGRLTR